MSAPTPRTDSVYLEHRHWANEDEATEAIEDLRDLARELEQELATERARLDWLTMNAHVEPEEYRGGSFSEGGTLWYSWRFSSPRHAGDHASAAIDAAMKEETK